MNRILFTTLLAALMLPLSARELMTFPKAANNYQLYPADSLPEVSQAPEGYEIFHIEHYGRHGSRWHIGYHREDQAIKMLEKVDAKGGGLTDEGKEIVGEIWRERLAMDGRDGELSQEGALQHRGIARRMVQNFPTVFTDSTIIDARATIVPRCILSMANAVSEITRLIPRINIKKMDASVADAFYMKNFVDSAAMKAEDEGGVYVKEFYAANPTDGSWMKRLFKDPEKAEKYIKKDKLADYLFEIAQNSVSVRPQSKIKDIFTAEETDRIWMRQNARWFIRGGNTPLTKGLVPLRQGNLLKNIIESADSTLTSPHRSANLRFGHEIIVLPFVVLLELNDYGREYTSLDQLADNWHACDIYPMACNVQFVFARPKDRPYTAGDVLVKVLLNERPARLPVVATTGDYVSWPALRAYYLAKLPCND